MSQLDLFPHSPKKPNSHYTANITLFFNEPLVEDTCAEFQMFYADKWGTEAAEEVIDIDGNSICGIITSDRTSVTIPIQHYPVEIAVVAIGMDIAQWTRSEYVIFDAMPGYTHRMWVASLYEEYYSPP